MHNLLRFIRINQFLLLFIIIEGFSIFLLLSNNSYQANKAIASSTRYTGFIHNYTSSFSDYVALKETNEYLASENAKLYTLLKSEELYTDSLLIKNKEYSYHSAKVINNSINKRNNFITLNKGSKHGITPGMGVITPNGVIGIIQSVSENYALAISLLHRESAIGIKLAKNNHTGILKWKGFDYQIANIDNFPNHIPIEKGDTIMTNSHSVIFPEGIPIGTINKISTNKYDGFYNINLKLFTDFNQLRYVYIIHSENAAEQLELEHITNDE